MASLGAGLICQSLCEAVLAICCSMKAIAACRCLLHLQTDVLHAQPHARLAPGHAPGHAPHAGEGCRSACYLTQNHACPHHPQWSVGLVGSPDWAPTTSKSREPRGSAARRKASDRIRTGARLARWLQYGDGCCQRLSVQSASLHAGDAAIRYAVMRSTVLHDPCAAKDG